MTNSIDAKSITHVHLLSVVATELRARQSGALRLLDVGCGDGALYRCQSSGGCPTSRWE